MYSVLVAEENNQNLTGTQNELLLCNWNVPNIVF